jgi:TPR repeat protein
MTPRRCYFRSDVNKPQLVKRAEADQALRKAAELGDSYSILILAMLLDRGDTVKRDNAQAIYLAERAVTNPSQDVTPAEMQVLLGRLLVKSDDPAQRMRGINLLEALAQRGRPDVKAYLAAHFARLTHCALARSMKMRYAGLQAPRSRRSRTCWPRAKAVRLIPNGRLRCSAGGLGPMCRA